MKEKERSSGRKEFPFAYNMEPIFRMLVCSDVHYKVDVDTEPERFEKGLRLAYEYAAREPYSRLDALYVVGDFADSGREEEMLRFRASLDRCVRPETQITLTMASHEYRHDGEEAALRRFDRIFAQAPDTHNVINGFHLIAITTEKGCRIFDAKKAWLKQQLEIAAAEDFRKPIFVFQHPHLTDTVHGSINWGDDDIIEILMDYPQVIDFSGHSHAPVNDPRSVHQKYFTSLGTGSLSYFELDEFDKLGGTVPADAKNCAQYLIVEAFADNSVLIKPFDILSGMFFNDGYYIEKPWDPSSFRYTSERYKTNEKPVFGKNAKIAAETNGQEIRLHFDQAYAADRTDSYTIIVRDIADDHIVRQMNISSSYYLNPMPRDRSVAFEIPKSGKYCAYVYANSFWNTTSEPLKVDFEV